MVKREYPYIKQTREMSCGAACIQMVLKRHSVEVSQDDIWEEIAGPMPTNPHKKFCYNSLMLDYFLKRGHQACMVSATDFDTVIKWCVENDIDVIANHRFDTSSRLAHYSVFLCEDRKGVHLHNPQTGPDQIYKLKDFYPMMRPMYSPENPMHNQDGIREKNTLLLINMADAIHPQIKCGYNETEIEYFEALKDYIVKIVSAKYMQWVPID